MIGLKLQGKLKKNFSLICLVALAGSVIFALPLLRLEYYGSYMKEYHLTNTEMGILASVLGVFGVVSYLFGGVLADGISLRKIVVCSLLGTGVGGLLHLLPLSFKGLLLVYALWGISTTFAFWPASVKLVRLASDQEDEGKAYGYFEGGQNIGAGLAAALALILFRLASARVSNPFFSMKVVILFYSFLNFAFALLTFFFLEKEEKLDSKNPSFKGLFQILKRKEIWIISLVALCNHIFCIGIAYYIPFSTDVLGAGIAFGAALGVARKFSSFLGNVSGGYIRDKIGTTNMMILAFSGMIVLQIMLFLYPKTPAFLVLTALSFVFVLFVFHMNYAMAWTMMSEGVIPVEYTGTAAGIICMFGAIPESFVSLLAGNLLDQYRVHTGYAIFFLILMAVSTFGLILVILWKELLKSNQHRENLDEKALEELKQYV